MLNKQELLRTQGLLIQSLRSWFFEHGYIEVQTPVMVQSPALEENLEAIYCAPQNKWLHTSPEFSMKKSVADGLCRIYQITPCFRLDEFGPIHRTEFRMLEWYRVGASWSDIAIESIHLINHLYSTLNREAPKFEWIPTTQLLPVDLEPDEWFYKWVHEIEPKLPPNCIVFDYPGWQAALSKQRYDLAERFEMFLDGIEISNCFDEEGNSSEIRKRWDKSNQIRKELGKTPYPVDLEFLEANSRLPRCSGIAMGIDRLMMILLEETSIHRLY